MQETTSRFLWTATSFTCFLLGYYVVPRLAAAGQWDPSLPIDRYLPCVPGFAWIYLLGLLLPFIPVLVLPQSLVPRAAATYCVLIASAAVAFVLFPTDGHLLRTSCGNPGWPLELVYRLDPATNLFPSLHVGFSTLAALCLWRVRSRLAIPMVILACIQSLAVCLIKQHTIVDTVSGALLAYATYRLMFASKAGVSIQP